MTVLVISLLVFGLAMLAMSVGVLFWRAPIRGSCGAAPGDAAACSGTCEKKRAAAASAGEEVR